MTAQGPKLPEAPNPLLALTAGGDASWSEFDGAIDDVSLKIALPLLSPVDGFPADELRFDFEADCSAHGGDADGDCLCDAGFPNVINADRCPSDPLNSDSDGDGVCDDLDNCFGVANPDQADSDGDGDRQRLRQLPDLLQLRSGRRRRRRHRQRLRRLPCRQPEQPGRRRRLHQRRQLPGRRQRQPAGRRRRLDRRRLRSGRRSGPEPAQGRAAAQLPRQGSLERERRARRQQRRRTSSRASTRRE